MPELPEVETVARLLAPRLEGRRLRGIRVRWPRTLDGAGAHAVGLAIDGARIGAVRRRGKHVVLDLVRRTRPAGALLIHLRMSGRLHVVPARQRPGPHDRLDLLLDGGEALRFLDVRKFGRVRHVADADDALSDLGPEPLGPVFTPAWLHAALRARRRRLKPLLLDQRFLAGLGNIYVDEALHRARLHPLRASHTLTRRAASALHAAVVGVLARAVALQGASFDRFYRTPEGRPGSYQEEFRVYGRAGRPCAGCGTTIRRIVVGQRGTHVCPRCQPSPTAGSG